MADTFSGFFFLCHSSLKWSAVLINLTKLTSEESNKKGDRPVRGYLGLGCFQKEKRFHVSGNSL